MKRRDLSAFEAPAPRSAGSRPGRDTMTRITLSLPTPLAERLKKSAVTRAVGYRAIIMEAVEAHGEEVIELTALSPGRTQIPLNLPPDDLVSIDRAASRCGANRSQFVTECLLRQWDIEPAGPS